jgi:hypothetical protein
LGHCKAALEAMELMPACGPKAALELLLSPEEARSIFVVLRDLKSGSNELNHVSPYSSDKEVRAAWPVLMRWLDVLAPQVGSKRNPVTGTWMDPGIKARR